MVLVRVQFVEACAGKQHHLVAEMSDETDWTFHRASHIKHYTERTEEHLVEPKIT